MFDIDLQYKDGDLQKTKNVKLKSLPSSGDYVQYDTNAFFVKRVYHIPKLKKQEPNGEKADAILFGNFISDIEVSNF